MTHTRLCMFIVYMLSISRRRFYKFSIKCHNVLLWKCSQSHPAAYYSKVIVVSTLNFAATQHAVAGARERGRIHECRMQIVDVAPESRPQAGADLATGPRKSSQCNALRRPLDTKAFFLLKFRKAPLTALCCSLSAQRRNFINEYFQH